MRTSTESIVAALGAARFGIVRSADALAAGASKDDLHHLRTRTGLLVPVGLGVDRLRDRPFDWESQCRAALDLAGAGAVLGLRSAARLHGVHAHRACDAIEVLVPRGRDHRTSVGRLIETRWLPDNQVTEVRGFSVTTIARTFFDLCGDPEPGVRLHQQFHRRWMERIYNDAVGRRGMSFAQEVAVLTVMGRRGRRGTRLAREILERFGPDHEPTMSDAETLFFEIVDAYTLPSPERQAPIAGPAGWIGTVDFLWRVPRHVVEIDSSWHDGPLDRAADAERDRALIAAGYTVARYRYRQMVTHPRTVADEVAAATRQESDPLPPERSP